jgi:MYXO-CTERM domain-containing protein
MWELGRVLLVLGAAAVLGGCEDSGQTGSASCVGETTACGCWVLGRLGDVVVTATVAEVDEAESTVVLSVDGIERTSPAPIMVAQPTTVENAAPGFRVTGTYAQIDLARADEYDSCGGPPAPVVGEQVLAGFSLSMAGFSCPGCVRDMDCDVFCPPRGPDALLHVYDGIRLLPLADSYDFAGNVLSRGDVIAMDTLDCASLFPPRPAPPCGSDVITSNDGAGCAFAHSGDRSVSSWAWCASSLAGLALRRRRRQRARECR